MKALLGSVKVFECNYLTLLYGLFLLSTFSVGEIQ